MKPEKNKTKNKFFTRSTTAQKVILVAILLLILANDLFLFGGNIEFYSKWMTCGQRPVVAKGSGYLNQHTLHYVETPSLALFRGAGSVYFCTPLQAEQAGFSANPDRYEFHHLPRGQWREAINKPKSVTTF